jgi:hypothetical protein
MTLEIQLKLDNFEENVKRINRIRKRVQLEDDKYINELADIFGSIMREDLRLRFGSSPPTTAGGTVYPDIYWRQLSDSYLLSRPDRATGQIYIDTGRLKESLTTNNAENVSEFRGEAYFFGTSVPYAEPLQEYRTILIFHQELIEKLTKAYVAWLTEDLNNDVLQAYNLQININD